MDEIEDLQADHSTLAIILRTRRAVPVEGMSFGVRVPWAIYLARLSRTPRLIASIITRRPIGSSISPQSIARLDIFSFAMVSLPSKQIVLYNCTSLIP